MDFGVARSVRKGPAKAVQKPNFPFGIATGLRHLTINSDCGQVKSVAESGRPLLRVGKSVELIGTVVAHDFHPTGKKLRRPRRIDPWRERRGTRGKLLFVHIWKLPP